MRHGKVWPGQIHLHSVHSFVVSLKAQNIFKLPDVSMFSSAKESKDWEAPFTSIRPKFKFRSWLLARARNKENKYVARIENISKMSKMPEGYLLLRENAFMKEICTRKIREGIISSGPYHVIPFICQATAGANKARRQSELMIEVIVICY